MAVSTTVTTESLPNHISASVCSTYKLHKVGGLQCLVPGAEPRSIRQRLVEFS